MGCYLSGKEGLQHSGWQHSLWYYHDDVIKLKQTLSALLAFCAGNSPVIHDFPKQRPVTRSFDVFFDLCLNKRLSIQSWRIFFSAKQDALMWDRIAENIKYVLNGILRNTWQSVTIFRTIIKCIANNRPFSTSITSFKIQNSENV